MKRRKRNPERIFDNLIAILFEFAKVIKGNETPTLQRLSKK